MVDVAAEAEARRVKKEVKKEKKKKREEKTERETVSVSSRAGICDGDGDGVPGGALVPSLLTLSGYLDLCVLVYSKINAVNLSETQLTAPHPNLHNSRVCLRAYLPVCTATSPSG